MADAGGFGARLDLDKINLAAGDYSPSVISCSETQERYCLAVPEDFVDDVLTIYNEDYELPHIYHGAGAFVIGDVIKEKIYRIESGGEIVCEAPVDVITTGISYDRDKETGKRIFEEPELNPARSLQADFLKIISSPNIASRDYAFRHYDSEVQGRAVIRPGEADAGVVAPIHGSKIGLAFSVDGNPLRPVNIAVLKDGKPVLDYLANDDSSSGDDELVIETIENPEDLIVTEEEPVSEEESDNEEESVSEEEVTE
jgi:phosphoribosylformylglycinamidine synthase